MWQVTWNRWRLTHNTWHVTCDMWHMGCHMSHCFAPFCQFNLRKKVFLLFYAHVKRFSVSIKMACTQDLRVWRNSFHNSINSVRARYVNTYNNPLWQPVKNNLVMILFIITNEIISSKSVTRASMVSPSYNFCHSPISRAMVITPPFKAVSTLSMHRHEQTCLLMSATEVK